MDESKLKVKAPRKPRAKTVKNSKGTITNGLADAIGYTNPMGFGMPGTVGGPSISETDTLQKNNRWYFVSNMRQLLSELYVEHGLIQTIVDVPIDDALRGGVRVSTKQLDEEQLHQLHTTMDRENDLGTVGRALKWSRLYGGAAVLIISDQPPETPLDINAIGPDSLLEFRPIDLWEMYFQNQNTQYDEELQTQEGEFYNYYSKKVHKSRAMCIKGLEAPSFLRPRLRGWGFSVIECFVRSINQYLKSTDLTFEVLDEFKLDIYKIKDLTNTLLSPGGDAKVRQRLDIANYTKNYQSAISMDSEDDYVQKQLSFSGLAEVQEGIRMQIASDLRMPLTKLFGESAKGFSSGQDSIEIYNSTIESLRDKVKYDILRVIEIRCQKLFGFIPDDLAIEFQPLRILSAEQEENVKTGKFNRLLQAKNAGLISLKEFRDACNTSDLLEIKLEDDALGDPTDADKQDKKKEAFDDNNQLENSSESLAYLVAAYAADRGAEKITHPNIQKVDEVLWEKAVEYSKKAFGELNEKFAQWVYKYWGGNFGAKL